MARKRLSDLLREEAQKPSDLGDAVEKDLAPASDQPSEAESAATPNNRRNSPTKAELEAAIATCNRLQKPSDKQLNINKAMHSERLLNCKLSCKLRLSSCKPSKQRRSKFSNSRLS